MSKLNDYPAHSGPFPFWFWNGLLDSDLLIEQVDKMRAVGIDEFIIHARYGLQTPFLSEDWFTAVEAVIQHAAKTGMKAWIYDELNWPSGSGGQTIPKDPYRREH